MLYVYIVRALQSIVFSAKPFSILYDTKILIFIQSSRTQPNIGFESHFNIIFVSQASFITSGRTIFISCSGKKKLIELDQSQCAIFKHLLCSSSNQVQDNFMKTWLRKPDCLLSLINAQRKKKFLIKENECLKPYCFSSVTNFGRQETCFALPWQRRFVLHQTQLTWSLIWIYWRFCHFSELNTFWLR